MKMKYQMQNDAHTSASAIDGALKVACALIMLGNLGIENVAWYQLDGSAKNLNIYVCFCMCIYIYIFEQCGPPISLGRVRRY